MKKGYYNLLRVIIAITIVLTLLLCVIMPAFLILVAFGVVAEVFLTKLLKKIKKVEEEQLEKERRLLREGYQRLCNDIFVKEKENKVRIYDKDYGFSDIVACEILENGNSINNSYSRTKGKIKKNNKIRAKTNSYSVQTDYCEKLAIKVTVKNFNNPNIIVNLVEYNINKNSRKYKEMYDNAQKILSVFQLIISKNNEKYVENGTVTKVEHRYITEGDVSERLQKLADLYKEGVLTEYEYATKKMELLDKLGK